VFIHRKFGYRGVIYGWDRRCMRDEIWINEMNANPDVPFYYVLPDENDCQRIFQGVRLTKYVGEDNMLPLEGVSVVHRALDNYFGGYSPEKGRYIPLDKLKYEASLCVYAGSHVSYLLNETFVVLFECSTQTTIVLALRHSDLQQKTPTYFCILNTAQMPAALGSLHLVPQAKASEKRCLDALVYK